MSTDGRRYLHELEIEVELELDMIRASHPEQTIDVSSSDRLVDPTDAEREEVVLRSILGAAEALGAEVPE